MPNLVSKFSHLSSIWAEYLKKCTRWWILRLSSCWAVKGRLRLQQGNVVTVYSHTSLMCEIPGSTVKCIHPSTDRALLRGDVTPTGVCFSFLFQGQEKLDTVVTSYARCVTDSWEALHACRDRHFQSPWGETQVINGHIHSGLTEQTSSLYNCFP